jgi:hypothetical protein
MHFSKKTLRITVNITDKTIEILIGKLHCLDRKNVKYAPEVIKAACDRLKNLDIE